MRKFAGGLHRHFSSQLGLAQGSSSGPGESSKAIQGERENMKRSYQGRGRESDQSQWKEDVGEVAQDHQGYVDILGRSLNDEDTVPGSSTSQTEFEMATDLDSPRRDSLGLRGSFDEPVEKSDGDDVVDRPLTPQKHTSTPRSDEEDLAASSTPLEKWRRVLLGVRALSRFANATRSSTSVNRNDSSKEVARKDGSGFLRAPSPSQFFKKQSSPSESRPKVGLPPPPPGANAFLQPPRRTSLKDEKPAPSSSTLNLSDVSFQPSFSAASLDSSEITSSASARRASRLGRDRKQSASSLIFDGSFGSDDDYAFDPSATLTLDDGNSLLFGSRDSGMESADIDSDDEAGGSLILDNTLNDPKEKGKEKLLTDAVDSPSMFSTIQSSNEDVESGVGKNFHASEETPVTEAASKNFQEDMSLTPNDDESHDWWGVSKGEPGATDDPEEDSDEEVDSPRIATNYK